MDKIKLNQIIEKCETLCGKKDFSNILDYIQKYIANM